MGRTINVKELRASLRKTVRAGARAVAVPLDEDRVYRARAVGRSKGGPTSRDHDRVLYGVRATRKR